MNTKKPHSGPRRILTEPVQFNIKMDRELSDWLTDYAIALSDALGVRVTKAEATRRILNEERARVSMGKLDKK